MYNYALGFQGWEDGDYVMLAHEKLFTDQEFHSLVKEVLPAAIQKEKEDRSYADEDDEFGYLNFADLYRWVAELLCERFNFAPIKPHVAYIMNSNVNWCSTYHPLLVDKEYEEGPLAELVQIFRKHKD